MMKSIDEYVARLHRVSKGLAVLTEADIIAEVQTDAFQAGYAQAARELFGIALESQERMDSFLGRAANAGVVHAPGLKN